MSIFPHFQRVATGCFNGCLVPRMGAILQFWNKNDGIVLALFRRYASKESHWTFGWGNSDPTFEDIYNERHNLHEHIGLRTAECPSCPFLGSQVNDVMISALLKGEDRDFSLPRYRQIRQYRTHFSLRTFLITMQAAMAIASYVDFWTWCKNGDQRQTASRFIVGSAIVAFFKAIRSIQRSPHAAQ